jgi:hypothetical protein
MVRWLGRVAGNQMTIVDKLDCTPYRRRGCHFLHAFASARVKKMHSIVAASPRAQLAGRGLQNPYVQTPEMCLAAVQQNGLALEYVWLKTPEICLAAVQQNGLALEYVSGQTPEIRLAAVQQNGLALLYVRVVTPEIIDAAIRQNGLALRYVNMLTPDVCFNDVQEGERPLRYVYAQTFEVRDGCAHQSINEQTPDIIHPPVHRVVTGCKRLLEEELRGLRPMKKQRR